MTLAVVRDVGWRPPGAEESVPAYRHVVVWCPGCKRDHTFTTEILDPAFPAASGRQVPVWSWDGNLESPTFEPSMLCFSSVHICRDDHVLEPCPDYDACEERSHLIENFYETHDEEEYVYVHDVSGHPLEQPWGNCHSFLRKGVWEFLGDSAHELKNQRVPMVPLPPYLA